MARYYDLNELAEMIRAKADTLIEGKEAFLYVAKWIDLLPGVDVVPRINVVNEVFQEIDGILCDEDEEYDREYDRLLDEEKGGASWAHDWIAKKIKKLENKNKKECTTCRCFIGCEAACGGRICDLYTEG